jgi:hypothetical protein
VSLLGAATVTAGVLLVRHHQTKAEVEAKKRFPAGESAVRTASLDKLRELGL